MIINSLSSQNISSLEDYYREVERNSSESISLVGKYMSILLKFLRENVEGPEMWGMTSHRSLHIKAIDSYEEPSLVIIDIFTYPYPVYRIKYPMRRLDAPWAGAWVNGRTHDVKFASTMLLLAIKNCDKPEIYKKLRRFDPLD